jgi:hypothetical protein
LLVGTTIVGTEEGRGTEDPDPLLLPDKKLVLVDIQEDVLDVI